MADPAQDPWLERALWAVGAAFGMLVALVFKRASDREDRDYKAREDFTAPLVALPVQLQALTDRVVRCETDLAEMRRELAALHSRVDRDAA